MIIKRIFIILFIPSILLANYDFLENNLQEKQINKLYLVNNLNDLEIIDNPRIDKVDNSYLHEHDKWGYLFTSSGIVISFMATTVVALYMMPSSFTGWEDNSFKEDFMNIQDSWVKNVKEGPKIDKDELFFNYITHPYAGSIYYLQARNAGFTPLGSFTVSFLASTFLWEYGIEAFAETPSTQDLIITPVLGSMLGEWFYHLSNNIKANDEKVLDSKLLGRILLSLMDPVYLAIEHTPLHKWTEVKEGKYQATSSFSFSQDTISLQLVINLK